MLNNPLLTPGGQTPPGGDPPGQTPQQQQPGQTPPTTATPGQTPTSGQSRTSLNDLPQDIQDLVRGLRKEAKESREALEVIQRDAQTAADAKLKEQGEFKKLAEQHEARVKELEPIASRYAALSELVSEQIKTEMKEWPASVKALDPGKDASIETRLEWLTRARAIVADLNIQARGSLPGNRPNPPAQGQPSREDMIARNMAEMRKEKARLL